MIWKSLIHKRNFRDYLENRGAVFILTLKRPCAVKEHFLLALYFGLYFKLSDPEWGKSGERGRG